VDSPWLAKVIDGMKAPLFTFSCEKEADLQAKNIHLTPTGTAFELVYKGKSYKTSIPLAGRYNVYNALGAISALAVKGISIDKIVACLPSFPHVPGRIELVKNPRDLKIFVDFAHSDDALTNVLECLKEFKKGRIITVFGCGGDRDATKRPKMAEAAEEHSDFTIVTTDNPRTEDPNKIIQEIIKGFKQKNYAIEIDRRKAIRKAIEMANPDDIILIAGKGHETYQIFAHKTIEFDDRKAAWEIASERT
jgi:UDP-N-acetylmuramoyl-L-alanyl-D-glutamate--2,6-diaminopimelate ligase